MADPALPLRSWPGDPPAPGWYLLQPPPDPVSGQSPPPRVVEVREDLSWVDPWTRSLYAVGVVSLSSDWTWVEFDYRLTADRWAHGTDGYRWRNQAYRGGPLLLCACEVGRDGGEGPRVWVVRDPDSGAPVAWGPESGDAGMVAADAAARAAGWVLL